MDNKWMFCLFALASLTSLVFVKADVTCYEGIAKIITYDARFNCSDPGLNKVQCEECFSIAKTLDNSGEAFTFGCKK
jgi:hypothetical protein